MSTNNDTRGSWASSAATRRSMRGNRSRDTSPELALRRALHWRGLRYRVDIRPVPSVPRRADVVFTRAQLAVFVDGCFWHGCPRHCRVPSANRDYWQPKLDGNRARDRDTDSRLVEAGWQVLRFWEHDDPIAAADMVQEAIERSVVTNQRGRSSRRRAAGSR